MAERFVVVDGTHIVDAERGATVLYVQAITTDGCNSAERRAKFVAHLLNENADAYDKTIDAF